jgi:hypothetical protein
MEPVWFVRYKGQASPRASQQTQRENASDVRLAQSEHGNATAISAVAFDFVSGFTLRVNATEMSSERGMDTYFEVPS